MVVVHLLCAIKQLKLRGVCFVAAAAVAFPPVQLVIRRQSASQTDGGKARQGSSSPRIAMHPKYIKCIWNAIRITHRLLWCHLNKMAVHGVTIIIIIIIYLFIAQQTISFFFFSTSSTPASASQAVMSETDIYYHIVSPSSRTRTYEWLPACLPYHPAYCFVVYLSSRRCD